MTLKPVAFYQPNLGADVEFFFSKDGKTLGSEKVFSSGEMKTNNGSSKFICDGVQAEFNPAPSHCRELIRNDFVRALSELKTTMKNKGVTMDMTPVIEVDKEHFDSLSEDSKRFGCLPSYNAYTKDVSKITVDPKVDLKRSAGGHIHLGIHSCQVSFSGGIKEECLKCPLDCKEELGEKQEIKNYLNAKGYNIHELGDTEKLKKFLKDKGIMSVGTGKPSIKFDGASEAVTRPELISPMLDLVLGIPSVLIDRNSGAAQRRKVYGKAGEFRLPNHGFEYRTLSNFWMRSYQLMSLVFGLARTAQLIVGAELDGSQKGIIEEFMKDIDMLDVEKAINEDNFNLAKKIWDKTYPKLIQVSSSTGNFPINKETIHGFKYLVVTGIDKLWPREGTLKHWESNSDSGWERWAIANNSRDISSYDTMEV